MPNPDLQSFLQSQTLKSPIAVILAEDEVELDSTVRHHAAQGFGTILVVGAVGQTAFQDLDNTHTFFDELNQLEDSLDILNQVIAQAQDKWIYYCFNAEYLFFPYCEDRTIKDVLTFMQEERRTAVYTYAIDLYPENLSDHRSGVDVGSAHLDMSGYYGMDRFEGPDMVERQPEIFGGLRWRFEEHIPWEKRRIDRISMFKATKGLTIGADLRLSDPEMNTIVMGIKQMFPSGDDFAHWPTIMATSILAMIPPVIVVISMQRLFIRGLVDSEK